MKSYRVDFTLLILFCVCVCVRECELTFVFFFSFIIDSLLEFLRLVNVIIFILDEKKFNTNIDVKDGIDDVSIWMVCCCAQIFTRAHTLPMFNEMCVKINSSESKTFPMTN